MRKLQRRSQEQTLDPYVRLWAAVLKRAYLDAIGQITDIYGGGGGKDWYKPEKKANNKARREIYKKKVQKDAIKFLKENKWIFILTDVKQDYVLKKVDEAKTSYSL